MKFLVTGGSGFIGSHIVERCIREGHEVAVIDDNSAPENEKFYEFDSATYHTKSICDDSTIEIYDGVDYVFHAAARSRIQPSIGNPLEWFEVNVLGTQKVLEHSKEAGVKRVIYSASSSCYGKVNKPPFVETMRPFCSTPYSLSKHTGEGLCQLYSSLWDLETVVLRYFNVYGPREPRTGPYAPVIGLFKRQRDNGLPHTIVGSGEQRRDFTYIDDVVDASMLATKLHPQYAQGDVFNIGTGKSYSINQISEMIGGDATMIPERFGETFETRACIDKALDILDWTPRRSLEDMINSY